VIDFRANETNQELTEANSAPEKPRGNMRGLEGAGPRQGKTVNSDSGGQWYRYDSGGDSLVAPLDPL
jgi:hypothetical protein